jgi:AraC family transcriptional regulator
MTAELVQSADSGTIECRFCASLHLLVVFERGSRHSGETSIEGLPRASLRNYARKLAFVPAGTEYRDWQELRSASRMLFFAFDPQALKIHVDRRSGAARLAPRLFFENETLWNTALKLEALIEGDCGDHRQYLEALALMLAHEIARLDADMPLALPPLRGGLAAWQQRSVSAFIEEHLCEKIPLATLSQLAHLSPFYFCRAFRQSFGVPPHRYHTGRRIERAKLLLADPALSITDIGFTLGFSQTSSFTSAFHKIVGLTPTDYRRTLRS